MSADDKFSRRLFLANGIAITSTILSGGVAAYGREFLASKPTTTIDYTSLRTDLKGSLLLPSDSDFKQFAYERLWNQLRPTRLPNVIVKVGDEQDVVKAVKFAKANKLKVVVRGGGHHWACPSMRDGGMMIDLAALTKVISIDPEKRLAVLQPVVSNREVQAALKPYDLAFPTGHCPPVKISGYLLGGGMSWNQGVWGPGVGSVEAIEIVTPDGELITASKDQHTDYFWAARGAGLGFFGVAVRYHLRLYPLPKAITCSVYQYPYDLIGKIGDWITSIAPSLSNTVELSLFILEAPAELQEKCKVNNGKMAMVTATCFANTPAEAQAALSPLDKCPVISQCLSKTTCEPSTFEALFDASGALWPEGLRSKVDAAFTNTNLGTLMETVKDHFAKAPSKKTVFLYTVFTGPNVPAPLLEDAAFSMSAKLYGGPWTMWSDAAEDDANIAWHYELMDKLNPHLIGHYVSESDVVKFPGYIKRGYSAKNFERIAELRKKHDPDRVFFAYTDGLS